LSQQRNARGRVGVSPTTRHFIVDGLTAATQSHSFENGKSVIDGCRMRKSTAEIALLRTANIATQSALAAVAEHVRPGMTEEDIRVMVHAAQRAAGLQDTWALVASGPRAAFPHGTRQEARVKAGEFLLVDTGGALHGYQSDITRTWPIGDVSQADARVWQVVLHAQRAARAAIRPGTTCGAVDAAARAVMEHHGFGAHYERFTHRLGHGIGLEGHEAPYFVRDSKVVLAPGMTLSNEPGIYIPGKLGIRIEDIVLVTRSGVEVFGTEVASIESPFG